MKNMKVLVRTETDGMTTFAKAGKHELIIDEGSQLGGNDKGANPMQTVLSALAGCENVTAHVIAKEMEFDLQDISFRITGEFNPKGFMGDPNVKPYFESIHVEATVTTSETESRIKELQRQVESRCPVYTLIKAAGVTLNDTWKKA